MAQGFGDKLSLELTREQLLLFRNQHPVAAQELFKTAALDAKEKYLREPQKLTFWQALKNSWHTNSARPLFNRLEHIPAEKVANAQELQSLNRLSTEWVDRKKKLATTVSTSSSSPGLKQEQGVIQSLAANQARVHNAIPAATQALADSTKTQQKRGVKLS